MDYRHYFEFLVNEIHTVILASLDPFGGPVTCALDLMHQDQDGLYFLTARGKGLYRRLSLDPRIAFTALKGADTMSSAAVSLRGRVREIGPDMLPLLFKKNPYMAEIYPDESSRGCLTVFQIYAGKGEFFDLSKRPIFRESFGFANGHEVNAQSARYVITDKCDGCGRCLRVCPQGSIVIKDGKGMIAPEHCLRCGECRSVCPQQAVVLQEQS